jgi:hypothetical protein
MSHIHYINGYANDAAQIQEHLERLSAARLAKRKREAAKSGHLRTFDSEIEAYQDREDRQKPGQEPDQEQSEDGDSNTRYA